MVFFRDRVDAGMKLAQTLTEYRGRTDVVVLALAHAGVSVAYEVAKALNLPWDIFLVRKPGLTGHEELAMRGERARRNSSAQKRWGFCAGHP